MINDIQRNDIKELLTLIMSRKEQLSNQTFMKYYFIEYKKLDKYLYENMYKLYNIPVVFLDYNICTQFVDAENIMSSMNAPVLYKFLYNQTENVFVISKENGMQLYSIKDFFRSILPIGELLNKFDNINSDNSDEAVNCTRYMLFDMLLNKNKKTDSDNEK